MQITGLTGSIASGKTTILNMFAKENIPTLSLDEIVDLLYQKEAVEPIRNIFPKAIKNNRVDKKILSEIILQNSDNLAKIEQIIHPLVRQKQREFIERQKNKGQKIVIIEVPLLFEKNLQDNFDKIILAYCSEEILRRRALSRENMTEQKLDFILQNQMEQKEKLKRADIIIDTSQSLEGVKEQVGQIINNLLKDDLAKN